MIQEAIERALGESITLQGNVSGGDINQASRAQTASGRSLFIKSNSNAPPGMFTAEAAGLQAMANVPQGCRIPQVIAVSDSPAFLVLEWIESGSTSRSFYEALGEGLAAQHRTHRAHCGFDAGDNYIGSTPQPNPNEADWLIFFRDHRIGYQQQLLRERGRCPAALDRALDHFRENIHRWLAIDDEPHALLHGDLWGGNKMVGSQGEPVLIDPAAYFGCREADIAMTQLFGGFSGAFYSAYKNAYPLQPGFDERCPLYNLYHVLNHANLFGGGYTQQALHILHQYM